MLTPLLDYAMATQVKPSLVYSYHVMDLVLLRLVKEPAEIVPQVPDILTILLLVVLLRLKMTHRSGPIHLDIQHLSLGVILEVLILHIDLSLGVNAQITELAISSCTVPIPIDQLHFGLWPRMILMQATASGPLHHGLILASLRLSMLLVCIVARHLEHVELEHPVCWARSIDHSVMTCYSHSSNIV